MDQAVIQTNADRYVIVDYIAEGGMGAIYLGKKIGMGGFEKEVVLKQLLPEFTSEREFIDLFLREAKLSASLDHANIVHTIDLVTADNNYFIVMEYVRGGDMRAILHRIKQRNSLLSPAGALFITREILSALTYAHDKHNADGEHLKLIHRDISPSNIMVSGAGEVKLADFGIAKVSTHKSVFYRVKGKIGYMSPEQAYGDRPLDKRSDLYSLGICFHEMLTGERLFVADLMTTPDQIYSQEIPPLEGRRGMPRGIDRLLAKALAFDPDERFQSAADFQEALIRVAFDNEYLFSGTDLARELRDKCGEDPRQWNSDDDDEVEASHPGTEILNEPSDRGSSNAGEFSGVHLTSIFSVADLKPSQPSSAKGAAAIFNLAARDPEGDDETLDERTRQYQLESVPIDPYPPSAHQAPDEATRRAPRVDVSYPDFDANDDDATIASATSIRGKDLVGAFMPAIPQDARFSPSLGDDDITGDDDSDDDQRTRMRDPFASHSQRRKRQDVAGPAIDIVDRPRAMMESPRFSNSDLHDNQETAFIRPRRDRTTSRLYPRDDGRRDPQPQYGVIDANGSGETTLDGDQENAPAPVLVASSLRPHPLHPKTAPRGPRTELVRPTSATPPQKDALPKVTASVSGNLPADAREKHPRGGHRVAMLVSAGILVALALTIIAVIGLSGPDLEAPPGTPPADRPGTSPTQPKSSKIEPLITSPPSRGFGKKEGSPKGHCALLVTSSPGGAVVFLDGHRQGLTPCTLKRLHEDHTYLVSVRLEPYTSWSALVRLDKEKVRTLQARLVPQPTASRIGYLVVHAIPRANVLVDGHSIGRVTTEGRIPLTPGPHEIVLTTPQGRRSPAFRVTIERGKQVDLRKSF